MDLYSIGIVMSEKQVSSADVGLTTSNNMDFLKVYSLKEAFNSYGGQTAVAKMATRHHGFTIAQATLSKAANREQSLDKAYLFVRTMMHYMKRKSIPQEAQIAMIQSKGFMPMYHDMVKVGDALGLYAGATVLAGELYIAVRFNESHVEQVHVDNVEFLEASF